MYRAGAVFIVVFLFCFLYAGIYSVCTSFHEAGKIITAVHIHIANAAIARHVHGRESRQA